MHPTCFDDMEKKEFAKQVEALTPLEAKVFNALNKAAFATGLNFETLSMQTDLREAYDAIKAEVTPQQFAGVCGQLAQKNLYRSVIHDSYEHPKKRVLHEGMTYEVRADIAEVILAEEVL